MSVNTNFVRYGANPVILRGLSGAWDAGDIANPDVTYDVKNHRWVMNYSGYGTVPGDSSAKWRMGLAYSTDLLTWTKEAANPVFEPSSIESYIAANGTILYRGGTYYYFYQTGSNGTLADIAIRLATSTDLINWTRQNGGEGVFFATTGTFDQNGAYDPQVRLLDNGTFEMVYAAKNISSLDQNSIGRATSTDGITWTKQGQLLTLQNWFNTSNFAEPGILRLSNTLYASWDAAAVSNFRRIGMGVSFNNGFSWRFKNIILAGAGGNVWDSAQVFDSSVLYHYGKLYLFYAGAQFPGGTQGFGSDIGLAIADFVHETH